MNPKIQPKVKAKREFININIPLSDFMKKEITSLQKIAKEPPHVKKIFTDNTNTITEITIQLEGQDYALNHFLISETIRNEQNQASIREYRYSLTPSLNGENEYFRFDFQPAKIPLRFPDAHINVNERVYKKHHLVYPTDTCLDLHKLTMTKAVNVFCYYESTKIHPATDSGKDYITLVN